MPAAMLETKKKIGRNGEYQTDGASGSHEKKARAMVGVDR
jgi:hypothetical protein